ncbi:MAG: T9SS type A sorting domain-containing protein, partial [Chitinophagales bacterium]
GMPGDGLTTNTFYQKIFQLSDPSFFHDDFQFRFRNIATIIGQYDCWNIDYVKMGSGRNPGDTVLSDVAIQYFPTCILKNYRSMPWNQFQNFQSTEKAIGIDLTVKNDFSIAKNTSKQMKANETTTNTFLFDSGVSGDNFDAGESKILQFNSFDIPNFSSDSVVIATSFAISATGGTGNTSNDTVTRYQIFHNEMAYDDGTPEAVYRLLGSPASLAQEYILNTPDTLRAVEILYAHTDVNLTSNLFNLMIWNSLSTANDTLLRDEFQLPEFKDELNGFAFYRLSRPIAVTDTFYIGWFQESLQTDYKMDVAFDKNDTSNQRLFFNVDGTWQQSGLPGSVMMRPVLGKGIPFGVGIPEVNTNDAETIFPNPARDVIYVNNESNNLKLDVLDYSGRILVTENRQLSIGIQKLPAGFYFLRITDLQTGKTSIHKFIKTSER